MTRVAALIAATLIATPAFASSYSAKPAAAPAAAKIIGKDISWACTANGCTGSTDASRPVILCQDLAKRAGRIDSFIADGKPLSSEQLDKCNSAAKAAAPASLATAN
jgi:hypothetical protein